MNRKLLAVLLALALFVPLCGYSAGEEKDYSLSGGISPAEALSAMVALAQARGLEADPSAVKIDQGSLTLEAGVFRLTAHSNGGKTDYVMISAGYLDANYAQTMGYLFAQMLRLFGNFNPEDVGVIQTSIDFNAFNTLTATSQTLVFNGNKIMMKVDPESDKPYQLILATASADLTGNSRLQDAPATDESLAILNGMGANVSALFVYDSETDPNKKLGKPGNYTSKVNFALVSLAPDAEATASVSVTQGGSIEVFANQADAVARQNDILSKEVSFLGTFEYTFICGNALLRLSPDLPDDELCTLLAAFIHTVNGTPAAAGDGSPAPAAPDPGKHGAQVRKGDVVFFGRYEQDNNTANGKEPVEWLVLEVNGDEALLISVRALDVYNTNWSSPTWDQSTLRKYMNGPFLQEAFSADEQAVILEKDVSADKNPNYASDPGKTTRDKVFALSYAEADSLLTLSQRKCEVTEYARKTRKVYTEGSLCYWWLRSPGAPGCGAAIVCTDGSYDYDVSYDGFCYGLRPAVRVNLAEAGELLSR